MSPRRERRNLVKRGSVWYFERVVGGRRFRQSLETGSLEVARERRDALEREICSRRFTAAQPPTFAVAAKETLDAMKARREAGAESAYSASTARDRKYALAKEGPILSRLGHLRLDTIDAAKLYRWHEDEIVARGRSFKTGENLLAAIEQVFTFARARGYVDRRHKPVSEVREALRGERHTKRARAAKDSRRRLAREGVLTPDEVGRLTAAARTESAEAEIVVLLALECGLRRGEIAGLRWGDVAFGAGEDDPTRGIEVRQTRARGEEAEAPKSGRARRPHLSRRLWRALHALHHSRWEPGPGALVVQMHYFDLDKSHLRRVLKRAGLAHRTLQNLRATCSSLLKQWGVAPEYVRAAIGHESEAVAREHYDRLDFTTYRAPEVLQPGETPMDLFARLCVEPDEQSARTYDAIASAPSDPNEHVREVASTYTVQTGGRIPPRVPSPKRKAPQSQRVTWRSQRESNPCLSLERAAS